MPRRRVGTVFFELLPSDRRGTGRRDEKVAAGRRDLEVVCCSGVVVIVRVRVWWEVHESSGWERWTVVGPQGLVTRSWWGGRES